MGSRRVKKFNAEFIQKRLILERENCVINDGTCIYTQNKDGIYVSDVDHISTRGSGGKNSWDNLAPLCRLHHTEKGQAGILTFILRYTRFEKYLKKLGRTDLIDRVKDEGFK